MKESVEKRKKEREEKIETRERRIGFKSKLLNIFTNLFLVIFLAIVTRMYPGWYIWYILRSIQYA